MIERRFLKSELRADSQGDELSLTGYASKFNSPSEDLGGFRETVMPGAFTRALREKQDVKFLMNHDPSLVMGRTMNGTLQLSEDATGLKFRCVLPPTQAARDLYALVKRGDIDQCSFAFQARGQDWENARSDNGDMYANRKLTDVDLRDCSAVTYPAYNDTEVSARFDAEALVEVRSSVKKLEELRVKKPVPPADGSDPKANAENAATPMQHNQAAEYHRTLADQSHADGKHTEAVAHMKAAMAHQAAASAADNAAKNADDAFAKDHAGHCTGLACAMSRAVHAGNAQSVNKFAQRDKDAGGHGSEVRSSENQPPNGGSIDLPNPFDPKAKEDWYNAFADEYSNLMQKGGRGYAVKEALAMAITAANAKHPVQTETPAEVAGQGKEPTAVPHEVVDTSGVDKDKANRAVETGELRYSEGSYEDRIEDINRCLTDRFGYTSGGSCFPGCGRYWTVETFEDHVIVRDNQDGCYYSVPYKYDDSKEDAPGEVTFGEMTKVEQQYLPTERMLRLAELRGKKQDSPDDALTAEDVSDPDSDAYDPDSSLYDESLDDSSESFDRAKAKTAFAGEEREGQKTKKKAGKQLTADQFAWVGDQDDPSSWKLPIHDKAHAANALARFNQTKGIPADQKAGVWKKIVAAAKKFGIDVTEEHSLRAGVDHAVTLAVLKETEEVPSSFDASFLDSLAKRQRLIEIECEL